MERRPEAKVRSIFGIDLHLADAADPVFDRIFDGDDIDVGVVDRGQRRIEGGGLAGAGRTGDEHDAVGCLDFLRRRV